MKLRAALHLHGRSRHNAAAGRELMGADNQAEGVPERKRLSAIAKIKQDLAWRSVIGVPMMKNIILTRGQAEELVAEFERLSSQGVPNLEAELGLALMFASMIPIYWRAGRKRP
jgi:hypothetical protein